MTAVSVKDRVDKVLRALVRGSGRSRHERGHADLEIRVTSTGQPASPSVPRPSPAQGSSSHRDLGFTVDHVAVTDEFTIVVAKADAIALGPDLAQASIEVSDAFLTPYSERTLGLTSEGSQLRILATFTPPVPPAAQEVSVRLNLRGGSDGPLQRCRRRPFARQFSPIET